VATKRALAWPAAFRARRSSSSSAPPAAGASASASKWLAAHAAAFLLVVRGSALSLDIVGALRRCRDEPGKPRPCGACPLEPRPGFSS
jgi:hypothetical protein